ncbi:carbohydrate ABC transporter permease [Paenibacillus harenae]|uniref:carbohydrate ABC transporter permease n=1 Tax=Paenibacillus harenae TaxID=306543 RepID=UPI00041DA653|nr:carbohydrate ABC transporter permease [Paenibacillus harenae]
MKAKPAAQAFRYSILALGMIIIMIPMYLTITLAFKTTEESTKSFFSLPSSLYMGNIMTVIKKAGFWTYFQNSVVITIISLLLIMILVPMVSFAISRNFQKPYYKFIYYLMLAGIFVPFQVIMLPILQYTSDLNLMNHAGMIIMYVTLSLTEGIFLCVGFLKNIQFELDEASTIDGCNIWQTFTKIIFPLMTPITLTIVTLNSLWIWNDFVLPLILLNRSADVWTLPLFIYNFQSEYSFDYNLAFAGFFLTMLPIILLYGYMQRFLISGLTEGALK